MDRSFRAGLLLIAAVALIAAAAALQAILVGAAGWTSLVALVGLAMLGWAVYQLRTEIGQMVRARRGEIVLYTIGLVGVFVAVAYLAVRFPVRFDMSEAKQFSLSDATVQMLKHLDKPVHVVFFHDPMMRETVELYKLMAAQTDKLTVEFYDPMVNPAQARMRGVEFAGTAVMDSEGRRLQVNSPTEADIANSILRISRGVQQRVCFLEGHGEPDPFSLESHDHLEGTAGHSHGLGAKLTIHERHGMAKARHGLEAMNYAVEKITLLQGGRSLASCAVLVVAGPKAALLPSEVKAVDEYIKGGGNALFMLDPFVRTGLEPLVRELGVVLDDDIVIDPTSHFWADISSPAVTDYNRHEITRDLPLTFFPGVRSLSPTPERVPNTAVRPLINSSQESWGETNPDRAQFEPGKDLPGPRTLMLSIIRSEGFAPAAEAVLRNLREGTAPQESSTDASRSKDAKPPSRIVVVGDSDFATNSFYHILGNGALFLNAINYLSAQENLIGIKPRTFDLPRVNLTNRQMKGTFFMSIILIPALMAVVGLAVWWRQR